MGIGDLVLALLGLSLGFSGLAVLLERAGSRPQRATQKPAAPAPSAVSAAREIEPRLEAVAWPERSPLILPDQQRGVIYTPRAIDPDSWLTSVCCCERRAWCQMGPGYPPVASQEAERVARLLKKLGEGG